MITNKNIKYINELIQPQHLISKLPLTQKLSDFINNSRKSIENILNKNDNRKLFIVGPCSIHNCEEAKIYANQLKYLSSEVEDKIFVVMRVYFEKPRSTIGWKGLINDPDLNNTYNINKGLQLAREFLIYCNTIELPCACEMLDTITPQYISDLISWGAIGARTTESQIHRQMVSGLSMPIGFKNNTNGDIDIAIDAIISCKNKHSFLGINDKGNASICITKGNNNTHIILRGSKDGPNYYTENVKSVEEKLLKKNIDQNILIDCSHGNSRKDYRNQESVLLDVLNQIKNGNTSIIGVMIESYLNEGNQPFGENLRFGVSITDSCINIQTTNRILINFYNEL